MRHFTVRAESGVIGFLPVRALMGAGLPSVWPRPARVGLRLVAPEDPACVVPLDEEAGAGVVRHDPSERPWLFHRQRVVRGLREVGRAWLDQVGPCRIDVIDADLLDAGSRLFLNTLVDQSGGLVSLCRAGSADAQDVLPAAATARELRIEHLARRDTRLADAEVDFLYEQAMTYLGTGDSWTAERILRSVLRRRITPAVWDGLVLVQALLGRPLDSGARRPHRGKPQPGLVGSGSRRPALRLDLGWDLLERWSGTASQIERNAAHKALFAIVDRTVFRTHETFEDASRPGEFFVRLREDLVLKIRTLDGDAFEIAYVGPVGEAPGIDLGTGRAA
ncbi:DUF6235 family protein [Streptomyces seoulensis]